MFLGFTFLRSLVYSFHCLSFHCEVRMFFIPSCCPGCLSILVSLSVLRTLRSVWIGSSEQLGRTRMVCCMYYTDVFVGTKDNIDNLNNALKAVLEGSVKPVDLTQLEPLASGLGVLAGLPACLCKTKKSVEEGLKKIYEELNKNILLISCDNLQLNCDLCVSKDFPCKCCVIQSIKEVKGSCECLKTGGNKTSCHCDGSDVSCTKVLAGLEACLHLQCLQADMNEICQCSGSECCKTGQCTQASGVSVGPCEFCQNLQTQPTTGLGLSPPNPKRLAERLEKFFGGSGKSKNSCGCKCGSKESCCCLACVKDQCSQFCNSECLNGSSHQSQGCPRKTFCEAIKDVKVLVGSNDMTCCSGGTQCHCSLAGSGSSNCSGQCCVVQVTSGRNSYHSLKCLIRRLVKFFKDLSLDSPDKCSKLCCELLCVLKISYFLKDLFNDSKSWAGKDSCEKCKGKGQGGNCPAGTKGNSCCGGNPSQCVSSSTSTPQCCQGCPECNAIKLGKALQELQYSGPCGQDLWRTLDSFLHYCCNVFYPRVKGIQSTVQKAVKGCPCQSKKSPQFPCQCPSGSSSCQACQQLSKDSQLKPLLFSEFSSAYSSSASLASSPEDEQKNAAKIFLGILPCLYYGLKYLYKQCEGEWNALKISDSTKPLHRFLVGMGFDLAKLDGTKKGSKIFGPLSSLFNGSNPLQSLYEKSQNYFTSSSSGSQDPSTVRQMLLWLYGLRFQKSFPSLVSHCSALCSPFGNSFHPDAFCYYIHTACFFAPLAVISFIEDSESTVTLLSSSSDWESFSYPSDSSALADMFFDYIRKIFVALTFLYFQCKNDSGQGGWKDCYFGKDCKVDPLPSSSGSSSSPCCSTSNPSSQGYLCTASGSNKDVHGKHCDPNGGGGKCINALPGGCSESGHNTSKGQSGKACTPCPHPLMRFLCDSDSPFKLPSSFARIDFSQTPPAILDASSDKFLTMGFSKSNLPEKARQGNSIAPILNLFCGSGTSPLTKLFEFSLFVAMRPPETLIELIAFFLRFRFNLWTGPLKTEFSQYASMEPGRPSGENLKTAIEKLYDFSGHRGSHPYDLWSLFGCSSTKGFTCGQYLFPLYNVDGVFTKEFCAVYLSYVCHLAPKLKLLLEKFHEEAKGKFSCCSASCKIVECPCALPFFYSFGFSFWSPNTLNCPGHEGHSTGQDQYCTRKTCKNFIAQLGKVLEDPQSTLLSLIAEIESFLWSIRKPFFLFILAFWAFVISYFLYVQLYKLDVLELNSHDHPAWSFKIPPSILFSDASSKLKDLSYFTL
ncbi:variant erythrocyte surface antigen-1 family protein [Babesia divergens]|uniref:Variant erythrocyte surface antigen-1 family protein n=1 Tax=Babesia divergens TaxID=32595 RepID=A0AAD9G4S0_BABDI|nr:variant erythrocyte surface antigen-1 family protein [Babesia divergens]